ncbi:hypothetical protein [Thiobacillus sp.]
MLTHQATGKIVPPHAPHAAGWKWAKWQVHKKLQKIYGRPELFQPRVLH